MNKYADSICSEFRVDVSDDTKDRLQIRHENFPPELYVLMQPGVPVAFYTQQCRALNLIWALANQHAQRTEGGEPGLNDRQVVIIGAGAAGLTAGVAAAVAGAGKVTILEKAGTALNLQLGCEHRFLHPRFHLWPLKRSHSAAAALPFLSWSVGTAGEVASRLYGEYHQLQEEMGARLCLKVNAQMLGCDPADNQGRFSVRFKVGESEQTPLDCHILIIAVGFGIERTVEGLWPRSYWRVDALTQPSLGSPAEKFKVLVAGDGDAGTIDVLRACLKDFDHGPFIDRVMDIAWAHPRELEVIRKLEERAATAMPVGGWNQDTARKARVTRELNYEYNKLIGTDLYERLRKYIKTQLREDVDVTWLRQLEHVTSPESYALNRVLVWLLCTLPERVKHLQGSLHSVHPLPLNDARSWRGYRACIWRAVAAGDRGTQREDMDIWGIWDEVIVRYGGIRPLENDFGNWGKAVNPARKLSGRCDICDEDLGIFHPCFSAPLDFGNLYREVDGYFRRRMSEQRRKNGVIKQPRLQACLMQADPNRNKTKAVKKSKAEYPKEWELHEIKIWIEDAPEGTRWVNYHLHPYRQGVQRRANAGLESKFSLRIFTHDDYWLSAELSSGLLIKGEWLTKVLEDTQGGKSAATEGCIEAPDKDKKLASLKQCARALWNDEAAYEKFRLEPLIFLDNRSIDEGFEQQLEQNSRLEQDA
jgi:hypothetical protein